MHPFSEDAVVFSKKKILDPENMKKTTLKVAHNQPQTSFFCTGPAVQMAQKQKSRTPGYIDWGYGYII